MDLGIRGKRGLVCAASKGLGRGCAEALAEAGVDLVINARGAEALERTIVLNGDGLSSDLLEEAAVPQADVAGQGGLPCPGAPV